MKCGLRIAERRVPRRKLKVQSSERGVKWSGIGGRGSGHRRKSSEFGVQSFEFWNLKVLMLIVASVLLVTFSLQPSAFSSDKWSGVDESVVKKVAQEQGRKAWKPIINTDQGDLLLFVFLLAGAVGGFIAGYYWRILMVERSASAPQRENEILMEHFYQHLAKGHWLARVDARIKLLATLALLIMVISYQGFLFPLLVCGLCLAFWFQMRIPLRTILMRFSEPLFIIAVLLILKTFFTGRAPLFTISFFGPKIIGYQDGLLQGLMIGSRIGAAVSLVALLGFCTPFTEFLAGLSWLRIPRGFIEIVLFAYRYIFVLIEDALVIYQAQKNRLGYSNVRRGLNSFGVLAGSLTLKGFEQSQNTAQAMVQRGYDGTLPYLRHRAFQPLEILGSLSFLLIMGMVWAY